MSKRYEPQILKIIGLTIVAIKGSNCTFVWSYPYKKSNKKKIAIEPEYIFFSDGKTLIELEDQDSSFHDCSPMAKEIRIIQDEVLYNNIINSSDFSDATIDI